MKRTRILFIHSGGDLARRIRLHDQIRRVDSVERRMGISRRAALNDEFAAFQRLHRPFIPYGNRRNVFMPNVFHNIRSRPFNRRNTCVKRRTILPARQQTALPIWPCSNRKMLPISQLDICIHAEAALPSGHFIAAHRPQSHFRQKFQNGRLPAIRRFPDIFIREILRRRGRLDPVATRLGWPRPKPFAIQENAKSRVAAGPKTDGIHGTAAVNDFFELHDGESRPVRHFRRTVRIFPAMLMLRIHKWRQPNPFRHAIILLLHSSVLCKHAASFSDNRRGGHPFDKLTPVHHDILRLQSLVNANFREAKPSFFQ